MYVCSAVPRSAYVLKRVSKIIKWVYSYIEYSLFKIRAERGRAELLLQGGRPPRFQ